MHEISWIHGNSHEVFMISHEISWKKCPENPPPFSFFWRLRSFSHDQNNSHDSFMRSHAEISTIIFALTISHEGSWDSMITSWKHKWQSQPSIGPVVASHEISWNTMLYGIPRSHGIPMFSEISWISWYICLARKAVLDNLWLCGAANDFPHEIPWYYHTLCNLLVAQEYHGCHGIPCFHGKIILILCLLIYRGSSIDTMPSVTDSKCPSIIGPSDAPKSFINCKLPKLEMKESNPGHRLKKAFGHAFNDLRGLQSTSNSDG